MDNKLSKVIIKFSALVVRKDLCKYEDKYEEFSDKKNKKLLNSITKADAYLEKQVLNKVIK